MSGDVTLNDIEVPYPGYSGVKCDAEHWSTDIEVNGHGTKFKLDTGAAVYVISEQDTCLKTETLLKMKQTLCARGATHLPVIGVIMATL